MREAIEAGQTLFGESRVQEARAKIPELSSNIRWHFVGHLQKNKMRQALPLFEMIHSVDSLALAQDINRIAEEEGLYPRVLLEVNVAGEGSKFGFAPDNLREQMEALLGAAAPVNRRANVYSTAGCGIGRLAEIFCASSGIARFAREGIQHEAAAAFDGHDARFSNWNRGGRDAGARWHSDFWRAKSESGSQASCLTRPTGILPVVNVVRLEA